MNLDSALKNAGIARIVDALRFRKRWDYQMIQTYICKHYKITPADLEEILYEEDWER
jgi:hypothetical protein